MAKLTAIVIILGSLYLGAETFFSFFEALSRLPR